MKNYISTNIISSPIHFIFCHGITISLLLANIFNTLFVPGTIIDVMVARLIVILFYGTMICVIVL